MNYITDKKSVISQYISPAAHAICAKMTKNDQVTEKLTLMSLHVFSKQFFYN